MIETSRRPVGWIADVYRSQLGKKYVMATTGIILFGFVVAHMVGNLKLFLGATPLNHYAEWLRDLGEPALPRTTLLWIMRATLLGAVFLHILAATQLTLINRRASPVAYKQRDYVAANYASRTMRWSGIIIALFVIYHLMQFTWGNAHNDFIKGDVFHNVVTSFSIWWVSVIYIVANLALGLHLYHGLWSMFQSLGLNNPKFNRMRTRFAQTFAVLITLGNISMPLAVMAGFVTLPK